MDRSLLLAVAPEHPSHLPQGHVLRAGLTALASLRSVPSGRVPTDSIHTHLGPGNSLTEAGPNKGQSREAHLPRSCPSISPSALVKMDPQPWGHTTITRDCGSPSLLDLVPVCVALVPQRVCVLKLPQVLLLVCRLIQGKKGALSPEQNRHL